MKSRRTKISVTKVFEFIVNWFQVILRWPVLYGTCTLKTMKCFIRKDIDFFFLY